MTRADPRFCSRCGVLFPSPRARAEHDQAVHGAADPAQNMPAGAIGRLLGPVKRAVLFPGPNPTAESLAAQLEAAAAAADEIVLTPTMLRALLAVIGSCE